MPPSHDNPSESLQPLTAMLALVAVFCVLTARGQGPSATLVLSRAWVALPATIAFAAAARVLRGVTTYGAMAGWAVALLLWLAGGWQMFALLLCCFVITLAATKAGYRRKQQLGTAERRGGRRASQVVANVGAAALIAVIAPPFWKIGALAVLCEATADTVSSEFGQAFGGRPRMITSFRPAPIGTDGGMTLAGTFAGAIGAALIAAAALLLGFVGFPVWPSADIRAAAIACGAGIAGMFFDSLLGATLERRGRMDNDQVNGVSTVFAALVTLLLCG